MEIEPDSGGKIALTWPQQRWIGDDPHIFQSAQFAGQQMTALTDDAGAFSLFYLYFEASGFKSMDDAKKAAPEFARQVLARMSSLIAD